MATTAQVRHLLSPTTVPAALADEWLAQASAVWLMGESAEGLASDLVLCHPPLAPAEVRAVAKPTETPGAWRLTVVSHDRPGLLADLAGALASQQLSIIDATATVLPGQGLALQRVTATHARGSTIDEAAWDAMGGRLQAVLGREEQVTPSFQPKSPVTVEAHPQGLGRVMVTIEAPDGVGLLWMVASWFAKHDCNVEAYRARSDLGVAKDTFVVVGQVDASELAAALGGVPAEVLTVPAATLRLGRRLSRAGAALTAAVATRLLRGMGDRLVTRRPPPDGPDSSPERPPGV